MSEDRASTPDELPESLKAIKVWQSAELFGDAKLIQIQHGSEVYQLRITRQGKLILNK
jgi:hemin uptake protein HemP